MCVLWSGAHVVAKSTLTRRVATGRSRLGLGGVRLDRTGVGQSTLSSMELTNNRRGEPPEA